MPLQPRTILSRVRYDALPENTEYHDKGCAVSPSCLTCPLDECIYVTNDADKQARDARILREARALFKERCLPDLVARHGLSERSLRRLLGRNPWRD